MEVYYSDNNIVISKQFTAPFNTSDYLDKSTAAIDDMVKSWNQLGAPTPLPVTKLICWMFIKDGIEFLTERVNDRHKITLTCAKSRH